MSSYSRRYGHEKDGFEALTPWEKQYLDNFSPTERDNINIGWKSEAL